ncbi:MAG: serpin family protein, partial [Cyanobacteria bacterium J06600_6]
MNRNTLWGTFALVLLLVLAGLVSQQEVNSISSLDSLSTTLQPKLVATETDVSISPLVEANNRFSFNLFSQLQKQTSPPQNIFISPQSIAIALAMTRNGTEGETLAEISQTLGLEQFDAAKLDSSYSKLIETLTTADPSIKLAIANSLWVNQDIELQDRFFDRTQEFYRGKVTNLDFADPAAKKTINDWVASNTEHKIAEIVDSLSPEDAIYLINAIYFQGSWTKKFDPRQTTEQPFYSQSQTSKPVAMMSQTGDYRYYENERFQAVRLPYGKQGEMSMYIFLPQPE